MLACHTSTNAQLHLCSKTSLTLDYLLRLSRSIQEISLAKYELNSLYTRTSIATRQLWDCPRYTKTEERWTQVIHNNRSWRQLSSITIMERHADPCPVEPKDPDHYWNLVTSACARHPWRLERHTCICHIVPILINYPPTLRMPNSRRSVPSCCHSHDCAHANQKVCTAYETLSNDFTRAIYDAEYPVIRAAWVKYDEALERWEQRET
jgi:hypothetical protein